MNTSIVLLDPAFHGRMLATWHSFGDGLFYPALVGLLGNIKLAYVIAQDGVCVGFATWEEARDVAALAKRVAGTPLHLVEEDASFLRAQRSTRKTKRSQVQVCQLVGSEVA